MLLQQKRGEKKRDEIKTNSKLDCFPRRKKKKRKTACRWFCKKKTTLQIETRWLGIWRGTTSVEVHAGGSDWFRTRSQCESVGMRNIWPAGWKTAVWFLDSGATQSDVVHQSINPSIIQTARTWTCPCVAHLDAVPVGFHAACVDLAGVVLRARKTTGVKTNPNVRRPSGRVFFSSNY